MMSRHTCTQSAAVLNDGIRIAYQKWQGASVDLGKRCLCLHGWLDNSNSFSVLGPYLANRGYTVVAIDHLGHGHSSHTAREQLNHYAKYVYHVKEILKELEWDKATLIGHRYDFCLHLHDPYVILSWPNSSVWVVEFQRCLPGCTRKWWIGWCSLKALVPSAEALQLLLLL